MDNRFSFDGAVCVEVQLPGVAVSGQSGLQWNFLDQPYLRPPFSVVCAVQVLTVGTQALSPISGKATVSAAIAAKSALTLYGKARGSQNAQSEIVQNVPLYNLNIIENATPDPFRRDIFLVNDLEIDFQKSRVNIASAPANTTDMAFVFVFYYRLLTPQQ